MSLWFYQKGTEQEKRLAGWDQLLTGLGTLWIRWCQPYAFLVSFLFGEIIVMFLIENVFVSCLVFLCLHKQSGTLISSIYTSIYMELEPCFLYRLTWFHNLEYLNNDLAIPETFYCTNALLHVITYVYLVVAMCIYKLILSLICNKYSEHWQ